jgi:hypothetical protein
MGRDERCGRPQDEREKGKIHNRQKGISHETTGASAKRRGNVSPCPTHLAVQWNCRTEGPMCVVGPSDSSTKP